MENNEEKELLLAQYTPLLHKVMKSLHLQSFDTQYEDYLQELRIKLIEIAKDFDGDPRDKDKYRFTNYAQRGLRWYLIDLLRKNKKTKDEVPIYDIYFSEDDITGLLEESRTSLLSFYNEVKKG